jgi:regulator of replication initiation timing
MGATDTIKEFARIAATAGLTKDVIDLLDKKASLLAEQVAALEQENTTLLRENRNLVLENQQLKAQIQNARPKGDELDQKTRSILIHFFKEAGDIPCEEIAQRFQIELSAAQYHLDILLQKEFVILARIGFSSWQGEFPALFSIASKGRKYVVENGLAD